MRRASCGGWKERTKRRNHARPLQWVATDTQSIKPTSAAPVGNPGLFTGRYYSIVAIPRTPPGWMGDIQTHVHPTPGTPYSRLRWENINLPIIARQLGIRVLHQTTSTAPLLSDSVTLLSPCSFGADIGDWLGVESLSGDSLNFSDRLRQSLAWGGMVRARGILWPTDLLDKDQFGLHFPRTFRPRSAH